MKKINLLPWRQLQRAKRKQNFLCLLAASWLVTGLLLVVVHSVIAKAITEQVQRNNSVQHSMLLHDPQIKELNTILTAQQDLAAQLQIIHLLKIQRWQTASLLEELAQIIPAGLWLTSIKRDQEHLLITGEAQSNIQISSFIQNLAKAKWLSQSQLAEINQNKINALSFKLQANVSKGSEKNDH